MASDEDLRIGQLAVDRGWIRRSQLADALAELDAHASDEEAATLARVLYRQRWIDADQYIWLRQNARGDGSARPTPPPEDSLPPVGGVLFEKFEVLVELARGGMGIVYKARHKGLGKLLAVKVLKEGEGATSELVVRFRREAELAARLRHPNIVPIHDVGEYHGRHYFTMDYIGGSTLDVLLREHPPSPRQAASLMEKIARAIHFAHSKGIVHRDLKPSNILIDEAGEPQITDFGLAREIDAKSGITQNGKAIGTPVYMSPEQVCGQHDRIDARTDVFALGIILYELLARRLPFSADSTKEIFEQIVMLEPPRLQRLDPQIPRDLETICARAMEKPMDSRYATALDLAEDLARFVRGEPILARPVSWTQRQLRRARRHRATAILGTLLVMTLLSAGGVTWWQERQRTQSAAARQRELDDQRRRADAAEEQKQQAAVKARDADYTAMVSAGSLLAENRKWSEARKRLDDAIALDPARPEAFAARGRMEAEHRLWGQAIDDFSRAIDKAPRRADLYCERGCAWHQAGAQEKAEEDLTRAVDLGDLGADCRGERGLVRAERGNDLGAIEDFTAAIQAEPKTADWWKERAQCRMQRKEWVLAEADLAEALRRSRSGENYEAHARVLLALGRYEEAKRDCEHLSTMKTWAAEGHLLTGDACIGGGDARAALAEYEEALRLDDSLEDAAWGRAAALEALHRAVDAIAAWTEFLSKWPNDPRATEAQGRLHGLKK